MAPEVTEEIVMKDSEMGGQTLRRKTLVYCAALLMVLLGILASPGVTLSLGF